MLRCCPPAALAGSDAELRTAAPSASTGSASGRYEGIAIVRMVASFFVTVNHTTYASIKDMPGQLADAMKVVNSFGWRVPFFLILAGFLFARSTTGKSQEKTAARCGKAAIRVGMLWLGWSLVYLLNPPILPLLHGDIAGMAGLYMERWASMWPSLLWQGSSFPLWFLGSLLMVWLILGALAKAWSGLQDLIDNRTSRPLLLSAALALAVGSVVSMMSPRPASAGAQALEVVLAHAVLPLTFVMVGAALWRWREWLAKPVVLTGLLSLGILLFLLETTHDISLNGTGPRGLSMSGLCLGAGVLGIGMGLPISRPLSSLWSVSPGIYCVHMLVISRMEWLVQSLDHWSSSLIFAVAVFIVSLGVSYLLSRFKFTSRFVK